MTTHTMNVDVLEQDSVYAEHEVATGSEVEVPAAPRASVRRAVGLGLLASYIVMSSFAVGFIHLGPVLDTWLATGI